MLSINGITTPFYLLSMDYHNCFQLNNKVDAAIDRKTNLPACSYVWDDGRHRCNQNAIPSTQLCSQRKFFLQICLLTIV